MLLQKPQIGVSACLAGAKVRYDGDHKRHPVVVGELAAWADLILICPESEAGLGTPRAPLRLIARGGSVRIVQRDHPDVDQTAVLTHFNRRRVATLRALDGCVLKSRSPSCGLGAIPIVGDGAEQWGRGVFAAALLEAYPALPVIEDTDLADAHALNQFMNQVMAYARGRGS